MAGSAWLRSLRDSSSMTIPILDAARLRKVDCFFNWRFSFDLEGKKVRLNISQ